MICKRCEQFIPKNSRAPKGKYCRHCLTVVVNENYLKDTGVRLF